MMYRLGMGPGKLSVLYTCENVDFFKHPIIDKPFDEDYGVESI